MRYLTPRAAVVAALIVSCGVLTDEPLAPVVPPPGEPVRVTISPSSLALAVGSSDHLIATSTDARYRVVSVAVEWSSSDPTVVTVGRSDGAVTAVAKGTAIVKATVGALSAAVPVTVVEIHGTLVFTRMTFFSPGISFDALSWTASDSAVRSVPRDSRFSGLASPDWSPDGAHLAIEGINGPISYDWDADTYSYQSDIYVANPADASAPWRAVTSTGTNRSPDWSPDGRRIAYVGGNALTSSDIFVIDAQGGASARVTSEPGYFETPRWSPDGTRLAYSDAGFVYIINADGTGRVKVPNHLSEWDAGQAWSPDGAELAWIRSDNRGITSLLVASVQDLEHPTAIFVAAVGTWITAPVWSPDGRWIALAVSSVSVRGMIAVGVQEPARVQLTAPSSAYLDRPSAWKR